MNIDYSQEMPVIESRISLAEIDRLISRPLDEKPDKKFLIALSITLTLLLVGVISISYLFLYGTGVWGLNQPVGWAFDITNFVFWVGIGHAGTLISAVLYLLRQKWRTGIARFAEAMTIFAVMCAGIFPIIHTGRPWLAGYLTPYPNQHGLWVNFTSPLVWDVFAVSTYFTVSLVFWYVGLIPDFGLLRDRTASKLKKTIYSIFSLGWRNSHRNWNHYEKAYMLLAGFATPLVLSVHTIVSFDFAVSIIPGWHSTIFPPYFVAGAIFSGFAMVVTVLIFVRKVFDLQHIITLNHLDKMNKIILVTGSMVGYAYAMEFFIAWYSGNPFEQFIFINRAFGPYAWAYWIMVSCNVFIPQLFWFKKVRRTIPVMLIIVILVNVGMWFERFVITVTSLHRDFLPSSWGYFVPSVFDLGTLIGSFGLFFTLVLLFTKTLPVVAISEIKAVAEGAQPSHNGGKH
ncbi:MAG: hydrogenase [Ignavibacteria bacterium CG22_combo_CG10-13_8_21_14_all_37_15]|nr:polysulfide reductase NrfD [Ignavibacteria bacterium]PIP78273.1 MAG: hydrogenase [Ignavibacteria bacterium CG22_combo_CG10-13_8_21_14_all_37_15]PIS44915.1 MAG: hydrogenase [Ignavibacteria bacterium CG08_land_8_20_14_0_20_37_9]PIX94050.1 MAG: hydrogenase [Ignavibacteria bacterium CG_4_10_14_3_um_filter_37_18]